MLAARMLLNLFIFLICLTPLTAFGAAGKIEKVGIGTTVKVTRSGGTMKLKEGDSLESGDELVTDASTAVDIRLADDTLLRVGVNSSYRVQESAGVRTLVHRLLSGVVRVLVKPSEKDKKDAAIKFRMQTPEGTIGVRGTEFVVTRDEKGTVLKGLDGEVIFGPPTADFSETSAFVLVGRGFASTAGPGGVSRPAKFDLRGYLNEINSGKGPFAPLAGRHSGSHTYARRELPDQAPAVAAISASPAPRVAGMPAKPSAKPVPASKVDYQLMLFRAAEKGDVGLAREALRKGANVNGKSPSSLGHTPLQIAMLFKQHKMFVYLITAGADVDAESDEGLTPLMFVAANRLDKEYAESLVNPGGADLLRKNRNGKTAEDIAKDNGYAQLAAYLGSKEALDDLTQALEEKGARGKTRKSR